MISNRRALEQTATEQLYDRLVSSLARFCALQPSSERSQISRRTYQPGDVVIQYGSPADAAYFILSGHVKAIRPSPDGKDHVVGRIGPGQCFGELALIESQPRAATIAAEGPLEVLRVESELFLRWLREQPELRDLLKTLRQMYLLEDESTITVHRGTYQGLPSVTSLRQQPDGSCLLATQVIGKDIFTLSFSRARNSARRRASSTRRRIGRRDGSFITRRVGSPAWWPKESVPMWGPSINWLLTRHSYRRLS